MYREGKELSCYTNWAELICFPQPFAVTSDGRWAGRPGAHRLTSPSPAQWEYLSPRQTGHWIQSKANYLMARLIPSHYFLYYCALIILEFPKVA